VRWETEWPSNGQLCHEYVYQKLLKLDNPFSSYVKENFCVFFMLYSVVAASAFAAELELLKH